MNLKTCALMGLLAVPLENALASVCTPTAAVLCVGADDVADVWINGICAGSCAGDFPYVAAASSVSVTCLSISPGILSPSGANSIAVRVKDTAPTEMWGSWSLDISCSGGGHAYADSGESNVLYYYDSTGTAPPPVLGGFQWYETSYVPGAGWSAPVVVPGSVYGKTATDPQTGLPLAPQSWSATNSGNGAGAIYFRQGFQLTPLPTLTDSPTPTESPTPTFSITQTDTPTATATFTDSPTPTASPTISPTFTESPTFTVSPTITVTQTPFYHNGLIELKGAYPNPFTDQLQIAYVLGEDATVLSTIYNVAGEIVLQQSEALRRGAKIKIWKGDNDAGAKCASGVYVVHIVAKQGDYGEGFWVNAGIVR